MRFHKLLSLALIAITAGCDGVDTTRGTVGTEAPEYAATTLDGDSVGLSDLEGKVVLLNVWATWCAPCREEIPALQALYERHSEEDFEVVGVSVDGRGERDHIRRFASDFEMTYPIWHDPDDRVGMTFRTRGVPETFLIDREGVIAWRHIGPIEASDEGLMEAISTALVVE